MPYITKKQTLNASANHIRRAISLLHRVEKAKRTSEAVSEKLKSDISKLIEVYNEIQEISKVISKGDDKK